MKYLCSLISKVMVIIEDCSRERYNLLSNKLKYPVSNCIASRLKSWLASMLRLEVDEEFCITAYKNPP